MQFVFDIPHSITMACSAPWYVCCMDGIHCICICIYIQVWHIPLAYKSFRLLSSLFSHACYSSLSPHLPPSPLPLNLFYLLLFSSCHCFHHLLLHPAPFTCPADRIEYVKCRAGEREDRQGRGRGRERESTGSVMRAMKIPARKLYEN